MEDAIRDHYLIVTFDHLKRECCTGVTGRNMLCLLAARWVWCIMATSSVQPSDKPAIFCLQIPRFAFEKFPGAKAELSTQMKSVGEAMAIGRTFQVLLPT